MSSWLLLAGFAIGYVMYYLTEIVKRPKLAVAEGAFKDFLLKHVPSMQSKFWPTIWCVESRAQTVFASILRSTVFPTIHYRREILTLNDGGEVALDWMEEGCKKLSPLILILPGLSGDSHSDYVRCLVVAAQGIGVRTVIFNNRGLGGVKLKTPRLYCASNIDDLSEVVNHIKQLNPGVRLGATGISMGGLVLGNYIAEKSEESSKTFTACQVISVPWNVQKGSDSIETPYLNSLLSQHSARNLCKTLSKGDVLRNGEFDIDAILQSKSIKEFDSSFTSKHFGFKDVEHYYGTATLHDKLHMMSTPLLGLSAADDPFQPLNDIPVNAAQNSSHVAILVTTRGGHIGFLNGIWPIGKDQYIARVFSQYFAATLFDDINFSSTAQQMQQEYLNASKKSEATV
ncbi:phospholipase ABHD3-like [Bradysia coprophila]|uniref:phospholipase ABHD3-like n=1 Tax=Bradysia coprophila TaxID=38358 RepID=UPI00187DA25E|nr:phospholipase ABHD3-like [Bradysia coprophila]